LLQHNLSETSFNEALILEAMGLHAAALDAYEA
jgi:hypothetical protein